jgi:hypothetical protein
LRRSLQAFAGFRCIDIACDHAAMWTRTLDRAEFDPGFLGETAGQWR